MADAITNKAQSNAQDLSDLSESYRKKRQEIIAQNEEEIRDLKDQYRDTQDEIRSSGDAAINHIRKDTQEKVNNARESQADVIGGETHKEDVQLKNMRAHNISQEESLKSQNDQQEKYYGDLIQRARQEKAKTLAQEYDQTKHFETDQSSRRAEVEKVTSGEVNDVQRKGALEKAKVLAGNRDEMNKLGREHRDELNKSEKDLRQQLDGERQRSTSMIKRERETADKAFAADRDEQTQQIASMKSHLRDEYVKTRADGQKRIDGERKKDDADERKEINRGTATLEKTRENYDDKIKDVHTHGVKELDTQKETYREQIQKQDMFYKGEMQKKEAEHEADKEKEQDQFRTRLIEQDDLNKKAMTTKNDEFQRAYMVNEGLNRESLHEQHDRYIDAAIKQKKGLIERYGKYDDAKDDPFYKMHEFETRIAENDNFYILKTKVPPHERHNIDVFVKSDHAVVTGQRSFEEKVNHEGRKVSTNSAESFREEIPLKHPTLTKGVTKSYQDGILTVRIPKLPIA